MAGTPKRPSRVLVRPVDARWVFNNFSVGIVLLDARREAAFRANTLRTALNVPPPMPPMPPCTSMAQLERLLAPLPRQQFSATRRELSHVVVFGDAATKFGADAWPHVVAELLVDEGIVGCVSLLDGGFAAVRDRYPFYTTQFVRVAVPVINPEGCNTTSTTSTSTSTSMLSSTSTSSTNTNTSTSTSVTSTSRISYPNEVLDNFLYLGNRWQAQSGEVMQDLGITHIVNASLDLADVWKPQGIAYCDVRVADECDADIARFFDGVFAFIEQARRYSDPDRPHRVLVHCTQGISRSATLVIMYLMRAQRWSLVTAFNATRASRPVIVPNDGFFRALLAEERRLYRNHNSVREEELDELLCGALPDCPAPGPASALTSAPSIRHPGPGPDPDLDLDPDDGDPGVDPEWVLEGDPARDPELSDQDKCVVM